MIQSVDHIEGQTYHGRKGVISNGFRYSVDFVLLDAEAELKTPWLFSRNRGGVTSVRDVDHGGAPGAGTGAAWVRDVLRQHQISGVDRIELLAQPRMHLRCHESCRDEGDDAASHLARIGQRHAGAGS